MTDAPVKIKLYWYKFKGQTYWTNNENCGSFPGGLPSEYILKDIADKEVANLIEDAAQHAANMYEKGRDEALKPIREVVEKYKGKSNCQLSDEATDNCEIIDILYDVINDFRKATKTALGKSE